MENHWLKRVSGGILAGVMILNCIPMPTFAAQTDVLCLHHTQHTEECGYSDAVEGHACSHAHTEECYQSVTECVHVHGDCGYVPAVEGHGCDCQPDENGEIVHTEGCGYVEAVAEVPCGHVCSEESGCITKVLNCQHQHDSECGYVAQKEESPCAFVCEECAKEAADKEAADTVAALIQALPTVDRLQQMTTEQQAEVYEQVQKAYDAYNALTEEQKVSLSDSEDIFAPLFDYFNTQTAPAVETVASGTCGENLTWTLDNTGNLMISGSGLMDNFTGYYDKEYNYYSDAPWSKYRDSVYTIVITSGVTSISSHAFAGCTGLTNVSIPDSVTSISPSAFHTCTNLLGIWVDDANSYYSSDESGVLYSKTKGRLVRVPNAIEQYSIPDTVTDIGSYAFFDCGNMTSIIVPKAVTWISNNAFEKCNSLLGIWVDGDNAHYSSDNAGVLFDKAMKQLIQAPGAISSYSIPDGVASICYGSFMHCTDLTSISIPLSVTRIDGSAFENCTSLTSITIPDSVTSIGSSAFEGCTSLTRAEIGNGISDIEKLTFYQCTSLESVAIADSVTSIGNWAFADCRSLASVTIPNSVIRVGELAFQDCSSLTSVIIPNSVTSIEESAFQGCRSLTNIVIPDSIKSLGESVFCGCSSATSITIPNSVTDIGRLAFFGCKNLKSITIPDSVTTIGNQSFCSCDSLTTIVIPGSVASIGSLAFGWCNNLSSIVFKGDAPSFADGVFDRITAAAYYPANNPTWTENVTQNYGGTITWKPYCVGEHTIVPDAAVKATCTDNGLTEGAHCSVCGEVLKEQKIIPAEHQYEDGICKRCGQIGGTCGDLRWQFNPVTATLTLSGEGDVPDYNSYDEPEWWQIDTSVLNPGQDIRHVVLEPGVTGIGDRALGNLSMLESVELPEGLVSLGNYCFGSKRNQISHIQLPKTLTDIQRGALSSLNTTEITIPNSVENLWEYALPRAVKAITFLGDLPMPESYIDNGNGWEQRFVPFLTGITATVYYPGGNDTWSPENRQSLSGNITWVSTGENMVVDGSCGEAMTWTLQNGVLEFFGYGEMFDYTPTLKAPWSEFAEMIREVRLSSNCRNIGSYTFAALRNLDSITIPDSVSRIGNMAFSNSTGLNKITFEGSVPYNISDNAFTGVQAFAHYVIGDNTSNMNSRLKDYGGNLIWVEHGEPAKMLTFNAYDMWLTEPGQVRTIEITAHPYDATADCEYSLSQEGIIQIQSQSFRSVTIKALSAGDVTITARDKNTGLTATLPVRVYDPKSRVINCPFQEDIFVDELNTQRIYQFTPEKTGYYALLYPYYSEGCGFSVKHGDEYLDCVSYQRYNNTDCMIHFLTKGKTYSIVFYCGEDWLLGKSIPLKLLEARREVESLSFEQDEYCFEVSKGENGDYYGWAHIQALLSPMGTYAPVQWMLSNAHVAEISWKNGNNCELRLMNPGTVVLTAYANGKFASTQIVVSSSPGNEPVDLELDEPVKITLDGSGHSSKIRFAAPKDGWYAFKKQGVGYISSSFPYENRGSENECVGISFLAAGSHETMYLYPSEEGETGTTVLSVTEANLSPKAMEVICVRNNQNRVEFRASFLPLNSFTEDVSWEISNPKILGRSKNDGTPYGNRINLTPYGYGDVTVTAMTKDGLRASCTVTVGQCFGGHSYKSEKFEPTCAAGGFTVHTCTYCGKQFIDSRVDARGHDLGEWKLTTEPSPNAEGTEIRSCSRCEYTETRDVPYSGNVLDLRDSELATTSAVWIDGISYPVQKDNTGAPYVDIPENAPPVLVTYSYNTSSGDRHTQYPIGMQAYRIHQTPTGSTVERLPELDNLLQYSGSSIRITGNKGIRMITSVNQDTRNALTGNGLAGFKLLEYGTLLAQTSKLKDNPLVLGGGDYVKSNYAYKKGVADPVFKYANGLIQYTNVLIGFNDEQCKEDIAMRPYMKLLDENGEEVVIYGGIVYRSIGYIAYQNRNAFQPGSAAYEYVWSIIHNVYGTKYDSEYRK